MPSNILVFWYSRNLKWVGFSGHQGLFYLLNKITNIRTIWFPIFKNAVGEKLSPHFLYCTWYWYSISNYFVFCPLKNSSHTNMLWTAQLIRSESIWDTALIKFATRVPDFEWSAIHFHETQSTGSTVQDKFSSTTYVCKYRIKFENLWFWQLISTRTYLHDVELHRTHARTFLVEQRRDSPSLFSVCVVFFLSFSHWDRTPSSLLSSILSQICCAASCCCSAA